MSPIDDGAINIIGVNFSFNGGPLKANQPVSVEVRIIMSNGTGVPQSSSVATINVVLKSN